MKHFPGLNILLITAAVAVLLLSSTSCGRRGDVIPPGSVVPGSPGGVAVDLKEGSVILVWGIPRSDTNGNPLEDLAGFIVMRAMLAEDEEDCPCMYQEVARIDMEYPVGAVVGNGRVAWSDSGETLEPGRRYSYKIVAFNEGGYSGPGTETGPVDYSMPPARVEGLAAEPGDRTVTLTWEAVPEATGYRVYRLKDETAPLDKPVNREPVSTAGYKDEGLENNRTYAYAVTALAGTRPPYAEGPASDVVSAAPADVTPPAAPTGLMAVQGEGFVLLSWEPVLDTDLKGYHVYRSVEGMEGVTRLTDGPIRHLTYRDDAVSGGAYTYYVSAVDDADPPNESPRSAPATLR